MYAGRKDGYQVASNQCPCVVRRSGTKSGESVGSSFHDLSHALVVITYQRKKKGKEVKYIPRSLNVNTE